MGGSEYGARASLTSKDNIESWINIAGSLLGVSKAMTAFLSGEMRDTVELVRPALDDKLTA